ncbi:MAG: family 43 glycosylhydrolase [Candidatus Sumerlaeota bacterium]|nr:family 43 glycosylhydrolase [Candidatus Sumerlaeota bacterium]
MRKRLLIACLILTQEAMGGRAYCQHGVIREFAALAPNESAQPLQPLFEEPLLDVSITLGPDRAFYLTGSAAGAQGAMFSSQIRIWRSPDMKQWTMTRALDLGSTKARAPEIHFLRGAFWLAMGMEGGGTELLKFDGVDLAASAYKKARITDRGEDPSLFLDGDGAMYWVMGAGEIARMKENPLEGLAAAPKSVARSPAGATGRKGAEGKPQKDFQFKGARGAFLAKINGKYCLFTADTQTRQGFGRMGLTNGPDDAFVAFSDTVDSGYSERCLAFPHAGHTALFRDAQGAWWGAYSGNDERAMFSRKPGAFKVDVMTDVAPRWPIGFKGVEKPARVAPCGFMLRPDTGFIYERGLVARLKPIPMDKVPGQNQDISWIRDTCIIFGHDGNYYMTGTSGNMDAIHLWRSPDLKKWEYMTKAFAFSPDADRWYNKRPGVLLWAPEIHYINKTYWIAWCISGGGISLLKSATGRAEGPYESAVKGNRPLTPANIDASLFQDDDGAVYLVWQGRFLRKLNAEMSDFAGEQVELKTADGEQVGYEGVFLRKIGAWYVVTAAEWDAGGNRADGTYDMMFAVSKNLPGTYSKRRVAVPHAGHGMLFKDKSSRWNAAMFGNDRTAPFRAMPGAIPLDITDTGTDLIIKPAGD